MTSLPRFNPSSVPEIVNPSAATPSDALPNGYQLRNSIEPAAYRDLVDALNFWPLLRAAGDNKVWSNIGYALLSLGEIGRDLWVQFSTRASNYQDGAADKWWQEHLTQVPRSDYRHVFTLARHLGWRTDVETAGNSSGHQPLTFSSVADDILSRVITPREFAMYPHFPRATVSLLLSIGGFGKSHVLLLIAICIALGLRGFGEQPCNSGRSIILTAEDDLPEMERRLQRILKELVRRKGPLDMALLVKNLQFVDLTGAGTGNVLVKSSHLGTSSTGFAEFVARSIGKADFVAIDTVSRFSGTNENDNTAAAAFVSELEIIAKHTGAAVVALAHTGKQVAREGTVDQYVGRGASAFSDNSRSVVVLSAPSPADMKAYEIDDQDVLSGTKFCLVHVKSNYARKAPIIHLERLEDGVVLPYNAARQSR